MHARNKILCFRRICNNEFPLRLIPLELGTMTEDDGFEHIVQTSTVVVSSSSSMSNPSAGKRLGRSSKTSKRTAEITQSASRAVYMLCFVNLAQVEAYMRATGAIKDTSDLAN